MFRCIRMTMLSLLLLVALYPGSSQTVAMANLRDSGPRGLMLFYRVDLANRAAFHRTMQNAELPRLHRWEKEGVFASSKLLFSRYADSDSWDMVLFLTFKDYADVSKWNKIEAKSPGGLTGAALAMTQAIATYPVDVIHARSSGDRSNSGQHVYLIVPYLVTVPTPEYERYVAGYVDPQLDGWMQDGVLTQYQLTVCRGAAGKPYSAVFLFEYKDDESFGKRDRILAETRERLKTNAAWKALADSKRTIRSEKPAIIADELR